MRTYAQNFEDVMLARLFSGQACGFYVDVGAWDPEVHSVTKHFYDSGWKGINVEPILKHHQTFVAERGNDINLNLAVGSQSGTLRFYECVGATALSTTNTARGEQLRENGYSVEEYDVRIATLTEILDQYAPAVIDFLKIDVEDGEAQVLQGMDFIKYRPRVLLIEATKPAIAITDWDRIDEIENWQHWEPLVLAAGYVFAYYDGLSRFYVRQEEASLANRLRLPAGVYDHIEFGEILRIQRFYREMEADHRARGELIERLDQQLKICEADRAARLVVIETLVEQLEGRR